MKMSKRNMIVALALLVVVVVVMLVQRQDARVSSAENCLMMLFIAPDRAVEEAYNLDGDMRGAVSELMGAAVADELIDSLARGEGAMRLQFLAIERGFTTTIGKLSTELNKQENQVDYALTLNIAGAQAEDMTVAFGGVVRFDDDGVIVEITAEGSGLDALYESMQ